MTETPLRKAVNALAALWRDPGMDARTHAQVRDLLVQIGRLLAVPCPIADLISARMWLSARIYQPATDLGQPPSLFRFEWAADSWDVSCDLDIFSGSEYWHAYNPLTNEDHEQMIQDAAEADEMRSARMMQGVTQRGLRWTEVVGICNISDGQWPVDEPPPAVGWIRRLVLPSTFLSARQDAMSAERGYEVGRGEAVDELWLEIMGD